MASPHIFDWNLPIDGALHGAVLDRHLLLNLWIALALLATAHLALILGLSLRRTSNDPLHKARAELLPLLFLALLFAGLSIKAEQLWASERYTGADPAALQVEVTGMQFVWYVRYPGPDAHFGQIKPALIDAGAGNPVGLDPADQTSRDDIVSNQLLLPINREVDLRLNAQDVIHGFAVPEMRLKQNAIPGQTFHIHFTPIREGTYAVLCTQVCGLGHHRMQATMRVVSQQKFAAWLQSRAAAKALSSDTAGAAK